MEMCYIFTSLENLPTTQPQHRQHLVALFYRIDTVMNSMLERTWIQFLNPNTAKSFPKNPQIQDCLIIHMACKLRMDFTFVKVVKRGRRI